MKWLQEVRRSGTTADKVAAMTLLLQESALANLRSLDELLRWVGKSSGARGVAGQVWYIRACPIECSFRELCEAQRFHAPENRYLLTDTIVNIATGWYCKQRQPRKTHEHSVGCLTLSHDLCDTTLCDCRLLMR